MVKKIAIAVIALVALGLVVALALPRGWHVERSIDIDAPAARIHPHLDDLKQWQEWSVWTRAMDPAVRHTYEGQQDGVGARWTWLGPKLGRGKIEITASSVSDGLQLDESIESEHVNGHASIRLEARGDETTRVTWIDEGELPLIMGGLFRGTVEEALGQQIEASLAGLKTLSEKH